MKDALSAKQAARRPVPVVEVRREFKHADRNVDGRIDFNEFRELLHDVRHVIILRALRRIDFNEFCELLQGLYAGTNAHELRQGFHEVDANKDGLIDQ